MRPTAPPSRMSHLPRPHSLPLPPPNSVTASHFLATTFPLRKLDRMPSVIKNPPSAQRKLNARRVSGKTALFLSLFFPRFGRKTSEINRRLCDSFFFFYGSKIDDYIDVKYETQCGPQCARAILIKDKRSTHHCRAIVAQSTREEGKVCISICGGNEFPRIIIQPSKRREIF